MQVREVEVAKVFKQGAMDRSHDAAAHGWLLHKTKRLPVAGTLFVLPECIAIMS